MKENYLVVLNDVDAPTDVIRRNRQIYLHVFQFKQISNLALIYLLYFEFYIASV